VRRSGQSLEEAQARAANVETQKQSLERELSAEVRRLRGRLRDAEASAAAARRGTRSDRDAQGARLRVLLDTVTSAAAGLRRELDLPATIVRPVDLVTEGETVAESSPLGETLAALRRGRAGDDPALVDEILAVPGIHLIVDGYNVTKLGYASLTLEDQRSRLLAGLGALAARSSGVELTCVFDATAAAARPVAAGTPRGVRVLYSALGELADQLIVRLAAAEPQGRPVVVVTNDREVIETVRRSGAEALPSAALLGRLDRG
jgi:predicted RNA-binding protein with PIN domain